MKLFRILMILAMVSAMPFINSCSDDDDNGPTGPGDEKDYYPTAVNTWWVYNVEYQDYEGNNMGSDKDSTVIAEETQHDGKTAYEFESHTEYDAESSNYDNKNSEYFYRDGAKFYTRTSYVLPNDPEDLDLPFDAIPDQWIKIADADASGWTVLEAEISDETVDIGGFPVTLNADYTVEAKNNGEKQVTFDNGETVTAMEYVLTTNIKGTVSAIIVSDDIDFDVVTKLYFAEDLGMVKQVVEPARLTVNVGNGLTFDVEGHTMILQSSSLTTVVD